MYDLQHARNAEMWLKQCSLTSHSCLNPAWIHGYDSHASIFQVSSLLDSEHIQRGFANTVRCAFLEFDAFRNAAEAGGLKGFTLEGEPRQEGSF